MALTGMQQSILVDLLIHGDDKASNISDRTGHHRNSISGQWPDLREQGFVKPKGGGVYRLSDSGRDTAQSLIKSGFNPYTD
jgi:predicted transcriptional regulator